MGWGRTVGGATPRERLTQSGSRVAREPNRNLNPLPHLTATVQHLLMRLSFEAAGPDLAKDVLALSQAVRKRRKLDIQVGPHPFARGH